MFCWIYLIKFKPSLYRANYSSDVDNLSGMVWCISLGMTAGSCALDLINHETDKTCLLASLQCHLAYAEKSPVQPLYCGES